MKKIKNTFLLLALMINILLLYIGCSQPNPNSNSENNTTKAQTTTLSSDKAITYFRFSSLGSANSITAYGVINSSNHTINVTVPSSTNVSSLTPGFLFIGSSVKVGTVTQISGITSNNFDSSVTYTVYAIDGSKQDYTVTVAKAEPTDMDITFFLFPAQGVFGNIDQMMATINVTVPYGTNVTNLTPLFLTTGDKVKVGSTYQISEQTSNNFSTPVTYRVYPTDNMGDQVYKDYVVTVTVASITDCVINSFNFDSLGIISTIDQINHTIKAVVPYGTDRSNLCPSFTIVGKEVKIGSITQVSAVTRNNFNSTLTYTVYAADGITSKDYTVNVYLYPAITSFSINSLSVNGIIDQNNHTIALSVPNNTNLSNLVASFTTAESGQIVKVGSTVQTSGVTTNNFSNQIIYTVTPPDGSMSQNYTIIINYKVNISTIATGLNGPYGLTNDGTYLFVADSNNHSIKKITIADGTVSTVASMAFAPGNITNYGSYLYFTDLDNLAIKKVSKTGGAITTITSTGTYFPSGITTDGSYLYYTDSSWDIDYNLVGSRIQKISVTGGSITTLANTGFDSPADLTVISSYLYIADTNNHVIKKLSVSGGAVTTITTSNFNLPIGITNDSSYLYVIDINNPTEETIKKVPIAGGNCITLDPNTTIGIGYGISLYNSSLYITDYNNNLIKKLY